MGRPRGDWPWLYQVRVSGTGQAFGVAAVPERARLILACRQHDGAATSTRIGRASFPVTESGWEQALALLRGYAARETGRGALQPDPEMSLSVALSVAVRRGTLTPDQWRALAGT